MPKNTGNGGLVEMEKCEQIKTSCYSGITKGQMTLDVNKIRELNKDGKSQSLIAATLGVSQPTLNKFCKQKGVRLKRNYATGAQCHNFKGYKTHDGRGCPTVKVNEKYIREHRLIAAKILGRPLKPTELVHHINGDVKDNRIENIKIVSRSEHIKEHPEIGIGTRFGGINDPRRI